jgi:hypothetical protein
VHLCPPGLDTPGDAAPLDHLLADVMARLGRLPDDPRPLPKALLDDLAPSLLPHLLHHLHSQPGAAIDGPAARMLWPLWLRALDQMGERPAPRVFLPDPAQTLACRPAQQQLDGLVRWIIAALTMERATRSQPRHIEVAPPQDSPRASAFPALFCLVRQCQAAMASGDEPRLDRLYAALAPLIPALPLLLRQWCDLGPARATLTALRRRCLPLLAQGGEAPALVLAALAEIEVALLDHSQPDTARDLRHSRRLLRRLVRRPWPLVRLHLAHAGLRALHHLRPFLSQRRFHKLERSTDKRDPADLADRWTGVARDDRARFYGPVRLPARLMPGALTGAQPVLRPRLAVVVHAYYPDVFADILDRLALFDGIRFALFVTCPPDIATDVQRMTVLAGLPARIMAVENRGRDVRPFFAILPRIAEAGFPVILKLHTKKSTHRSDGALWGGSIVSALTLPDRVARVLEGFAAEPRLGLVAARDHVLPISPFLNGNGPHVHRLAGPAGIGIDHLRGGVFAAGTMMFLRTDAAMALRAVITPTAFEPEAGQTDGTYAHAIERVFVVHAQAQGWAARDTELRLL